MVKTVAELNDLEIIIGKTEYGFKNLGLRRLDSMKSTSEKKNHYSDIQDRLSITMTPIGR